MKKRAILLALTLVGTAGVSGAAAQDVLTSDPNLPTTRVGTRGAAFLALGVGARAQALGGAYAALSNDVSALYWNTAGIGMLDGFSANFTSTQLYDDLDITHTFVGAVLPIGLTRLGVSVNTLNSGEMEWQDESFPNAGFGGDLNPTAADFEWTGTAVGVHLARPITDRLVFGGAVKYVEEGIPGAEATYVGVDLGTIFRTGLYGITLGASLQNLGSAGSFEGQLLNQRFNTSNNESQIGDFVRIVEAAAVTAELEMPTVFRFSVMADLVGDATAMIAPNPNQSLRVVWDLADAIDTDLQTSLGLEYGLRDFAFLRAGKRWFNEAQISHDFTHGASFGGGLRLPLGELGMFQLDYAYTDMEDLENVQVFSVELQF